MSTGTRLIDIISRNRGGANKDIAKFADQLDSLIKKWER
jgi:metallo-beta-lactamase family protein